MIEEFQKRPVIVRTLLWSGDNINEVIKFLGEDFRGWNMKNVSSQFDKPSAQIIIRTLEGEITASEGDRIIEGVNGEHYPCKPDIFEKTYTKPA